MDVIAAHPAAEVDGLPVLVTADEIVHRMQARYAAMESYRDEGCVLVYFETDSPFTEQKCFLTAFIRPGHLRFEFAVLGGQFVSEEGHRYIVWAAGEGARSWWTVTKELQTHESIEAALGRPTGVSSLSAVIITGLLMPEHGWGSPIERVMNPVLTGTERIDDHECFRLEANGGGKIGPWTIWIDRESFLIRRIDWMHHIPEPVRSTMSIAPLEDPAIPLTAFEFSPPE